MLEVSEARERRLLIAIGVILFAFSIADIGRRIHLNLRASSFVAVPARIVTSQQSPQARKGGRVGRVEFEYVVGRGSYTASHEFETANVAQFVAAHPVDRQVTAYYDPEEPSRAWLTRGVPALGGFGAYLLVPSVLMLAFGLARSRRRNDKP